MKKAVKKAILGLVTCLCLQNFSACGGGNSAEEPKGGAEGNANNSNVNESYPEVRVEENHRAIVDETNCLAIDLGSPEGSSDYDVSIKAEEGALTIDIKAAEALCLKLSGTFDGGVKVKNSKNVDIDLIFDNISITSNAHDGFLKLNTGDDNSGALYLVKLVGNSSISGSATEEAKKVLSAQTHLSFIGDGVLNVNAQYKTAIACDDVLKIYSGTININVDRKEAAKIDGYAEKGFGIKAGSVKYAINKSHKCFH